MNRRLSFLPLISLLLILSSNAAAHDVFIMPEQFRIRLGDTVKIGFHSADGFPDSTGAPKRLQLASLHTAQGPSPVSWIEEGKRMVGNVMPVAAGHVVVGVVNAPATETMKPASFLDYIKEEGLSHVIDSRADRGEADKPAREKYTMYAKSILLVGQPDGAYRRALGFPIEIVPEVDPYAIKNGESLPVQVLFRGAPARGLQVMVASTTSGGGKNQVVGRTKRSRANSHSRQLRKMADSYASDGAGVSGRCGVGELLGNAYV